MSWSEMAFFASECATLTFLNETDYFSYANKVFCVFFMLVSITTSPPKYSYDCVDEDIIGS